MRVSVETKGELGRRVTVAVPAERLEEAVSTRLKRLARGARMSGFRPGKVPMKLIEAKYGGQVMGEAASELIDSSLRDALGEQDLRPAGTPSIEPQSVERGKDLEYVADFEVYPQVRKTDIKGARIERPVSDVRDEDIDRTIERIREQHSDWVEVDRPAAEGDRVVMDFRGTVDGEPFPGGEATDHEAELGTGNLLEAFETQLLGAGAGDSRHVEFDFPQDYGGEALAGKHAVFEVTVKAVKEARKPEVNDELAKRLGLGEGGVERMREEVRRNLEREMNERVRARLREQVMDALLEGNDFEVPRALVEQEIDRVLAPTREQLARQGIPEEQAGIDRERLVPQATRRVRLGLAMYEIVHRDNLSADPDRVRRRLEEMASGYEDPEAFVKWHYAEPQRLGNVQAEVLEEQVVEKLLADADVVDKPVPFDELMRGDSPEEGSGGSTEPEKEST